MSSLDDTIAKIPRPILVIVVLSLALAYIIHENPMVDGCGHQITNFEKEVRGILTGYKLKDKGIQFAKINQFKDLCKSGNSLGSCENYYQALNKTTKALKLIEPKCFDKLIIEHKSLVTTLSDGLSIMALNAWGLAPPQESNQRLGWLTQGDLAGFCRLKEAITQIAGDAQYKAARALTYKEFPDVWPETIEIEKRSSENRPRAMKSDIYPNGKYTEKEIFEKSLFSIRCDLYK